MKNKILEETYHLIVTQGYDKISLSKIASAVSIQKSSLYYHFSSRDEILLSTVEKYYKDIYSPNTTFYIQCEKTEDFWSALTHFGEETLKNFEADKEYQQFYYEICIQSKRNATLQAYFEKSDAACAKQLELFFKKGKELGALPPDFNTTREVETVTALIIGLSEMLLYHIKVDCYSVWQNYVTRFHQQYKTI